MRAKSTAEYQEGFWDRVQVTESCWLWTGTVSRGYGRFWVGRNVPAHRFAYELVVGPIPEGLELDHLCRVRHCVNTDHLEPVTRSENVLRGLRSALAPPRPTNCNHGHPRIGYNLMVGLRHGKPVSLCRLCFNAYQRKYQQKRRSLRTAS